MARYILTDKGNDYFFTENHLLADGRDYYDSLKESIT